MSTPKGGLGRGLGSLIPQDAKKPTLRTTEKAPDHERIYQIPVNQVRPNPHQPRLKFDEEALEDLKASIEVHGITQPLIVTKLGEGQYELVAGERRLRAAMGLDMDTVPAIVKNLDEQKKLALALIENIQRQDLNPIEEARAYQKLIDQFQYTHETIAKQVGKSRPVVSNHLRLLTLPNEIQRALVDGKLSYAAARPLVSMSSKEQQLKFFNRILKQNLSSQSVEGQAHKVAVKPHYRSVQKDPALKGLEERLQQKLATKAHIKKSGETGQIVINFYSEEELYSIIRLMLGED
ncbi:MAG: hypothetical protein COT81_02790 [Candidatus Buchananbacteria bacterium CG10_big_fil_rev_8_21_14_0_10_42_9]|uniref:ParB-like N-terminal domain-containing protein n=1 Tax=Candidatus Buchananbacteria bacterium CG10_big_fil_rev_8_21_14_0_10_42_9 TaxID=1974526 RepID=A0A2H0W1B5_9BACT|nr:MAG: hypothetical protein COT81_02790 [Candidatus Buchananbacteria bacterium CG10_big_fil_rev_8_21_14_0_10_42_9]